MVLSEALYRSDTLWIEYYYTPERQNKRLAFVFSSLGSKILNQNINGGDYLIENGFDVINFNSSRNDWFQSVPADVFAAIAKIDSAQDLRAAGRNGFLDGGDTRRSPFPSICDVTRRLPIPRKTKSPSSPIRDLPVTSKTSNGCTRFPPKQSPTHANSSLFTTTRICTTKCMRKD